MFSLSISQHLRACVAALLLTVVLLCVGLATVHAQSVGVAATNSPEQWSAVGVDSYGALYVGSQTSATLRKWPSHASAAGAGELLVPTPAFTTVHSITIDRQDTLYVGDQFRVLRWTLRATAGSTQSDILAAPATGTEFNTPCGIFVDVSNFLYVSDCGNHRVLRFANAQQTSVLGPTGVLVLTPTVNSLGFNYPKGLVIDTEDNLLIADNGRNRIVVIPALGTGTAYALSPSSFASPSGITMDANGVVYIASYTGGKVWKVLAPYSSNVASATSYAVDGTGPDYVIVDETGLYVTATQNGASNHQIEKFSALTGPRFLGGPTASVSGDPQFAGLRGQSWQMHGIPDTIYNLVTSRSFQLNARFVFLSAGHCPAGWLDCWTHPGTYLGEVGAAINVPGGSLSAESNAEQSEAEWEDEEGGSEQLVTIVFTAGSWQRGLQLQVNGQPLVLNNASLIYDLQRGDLRPADTEARVSGVLSGGAGAPLSMEDGASGGENLLGASAVPETTAARAAAASSTRYGLTFIDSHTVRLFTPEWEVRLSNSDGFFNQALSCRLLLQPLLQRADYAPPAKEAQLESAARALGIHLPHGLVGQTWRLRRYASRWRWIAGGPEEYAVADGLTGSDFYFNRFKPAETSALAFE